MQKEIVQIAKVTTAPIVCLVTPSFLALLLSIESDANLKRLRKKCSQMRQPRIKFDGSKSPKPWSCAQCNIEFSGIGDAAVHVTEKHNTKRKQHYKHHPIDEKLPHPTPAQRKSVRAFIAEGKSRRGRNGKTDNL